MASALPPSKAACAVLVTTVEPIRAGYGDEAQPCATRRRATRDEKVIQHVEVFPPADISAGLRARAHDAGRRECDPDAVLDQLLTHPVL